MKAGSKMKKKVASILLLLTMIMCQTPALAFAAETPADASIAAAGTQSDGQDSFQEEKKIDIPGGEEEQTQNVQKENEKNSADIKDDDTIITDSSADDTVSQKEEKPNSSKEEVEPAEIRAAGKVKAAQTYKISLSGDGNGSIHPLNKTEQGYYKWDGYTEGEKVNLSIGGLYGYLIKSLSVETASGAVVPTYGDYGKSFDMPASDVVIKYTTENTGNGNIAIGMYPYGAGSDSFVATDNYGNKQAESGLCNSSLTKGWTVTMRAVPGEGKRFVGWYEGTFAKEGEEHWGFITGYKEPCYSIDPNYTFISGQGPENLCAVFEENVAPMTYIYYSSGEGAGGTAFSDAVSSGSEYTVKQFTDFSTFKAPEGHRFAGWTLSTDGSKITKEQLDNGYKMTVPEIEGSTKSLTFTAYYTETKTVSFDTRNKYTPVPVTQTVDKGSKVSRPEHPASNEHIPSYDTTGLSFRNWYICDPDDLTADTVGKTNTDGGAIFDFNNTKIDSDIILKAGYEGTLSAQAYDETQSRDYYGGTIGISSILGSTGSGSSVSATAVEGTEVTLTAQPGSGYVFIGWSTDKSESGIVSTQSAYTFTFNQKKQLYAIFEEDAANMYRLYVSTPTAGTGAEGRSPDIKDVGDKAVATASWVPTKSDVEKERAYHTGKSTDTYDTCKGLFQAGETYYSIGIVTFDNSDEANINRVRMIETDNVKQIGSPEISADKKTVAVAFSVTIPAITVTAEFGSKHAAYAARTAAEFDGVQATVSGSTLTYKAQKDTDMWLSVTKPLREALFAVSNHGNNIDNGEKLEMTKGGLNFKPLEKYEDYDAWEKDSGVLSDTGNVANDVKLYVQWRKPTAVRLRIKQPVCGNDITFNDPESSTAPDISIISGNASLYDNLLPYWRKGDDTTEPSTEKVKGGEEYTALTYLAEVFPYYIDNNDISVENGTISFEREYYLIKVAAVHDWGDWKVETEPTETEEGLEARTCKTPDCTGRETRTIPKLEVKYSFTSGDGSKWKKGSDDGLRFVVNRNRNDAVTFEHFRGIKVDGAEVPANEFTATAGSVVIVLHSSYLKTLSKGSHTITAVFDDGNKEASAKFSVVTKSKSGSSSDSDSPKTGDDRRVLVWIVILCTAGLALSERMIRRLKEHKNNR